LFNASKKAIEEAPEGQKLATAKNFWCNVAPQLVFNATARCVKKCVGDDDDFFGLGDNRIWYNNFSNNTGLGNFLNKFDCPQKSCDEIIAAGLAANAELQGVINGSMAMIAKVSTFLLAVLGVVTLIVA